MPRRTAQQGDTEPELSVDCRAVHRDPDDEWRVLPHRLAISSGLFKHAVGGCSLSGAVPGRAKPQKRSVVPVLKIDSRQRREQA
eukprot:SAG31_NODE_1123_length_9787_cov_5.258877_1_plen_84_part_00